MVRVMTALVLALAAFALVSIFWAIRLDEMDAHLIHGPNDGCVDCSTK
jgi:hypothetical protein